jgi:protein-S-isoprenylcysteine O-methyltransferase Ste14
MERPSRPRRRSVSWRCGPLPARLGIALATLFGGGSLLLFGAFLFVDPLGVGPIKDRLRGREPTESPFAVRGPYRWVRHPQYFFSLVLIWWYPDLTADRLLFNVILTVWIVLGTILEERDLVREFGDDYATYQRHVPILVPWRPPWAP